MRLKHDLRHELDVVCLQGSALLNALQDLPADEPLMLEALEALDASDRVQMHQNLGVLGQRLYQIREQVLWVRQHLKE
jgi:hypothetical protein